VTRCHIGLQCTAVGAAQDQDSRGRVSWVYVQEQIEQQAAGQDTTAGRVQAALSQHSVSAAEKAEAAHEQRRRLQKATKHAAQPQAVGYVSGAAITGRWC
jgi:hypothetical protein